MNPIVFNVKDKSANAFFAEHLITGEKPERRGLEEQSPYYFMRDEIIIKKTSGLSEVQQVIFQLADQSSGSRKPLLNTYIYAVMKYDDVSIKLQLIDHRISHEPTSSPAHGQ